MMEFLRTGFETQFFFFREADLVTHVQRLEDQMQKQAADIKAAAAAAPSPKETQEDTTPSQSEEIQHLSAALERSAAANEVLKNENIDLVSRR